MIVLDASVLIGHLDANDALHGRATALLHDAGDEPLSASPITLAEVLVGPARSGRLDAALAALTLLGVAIVDLAPDAPLRLALLRAGTSLKMPDCCVLLAAEQTQGVVAAFDDRLLSVARGRGLAARHS